VGEGSVNSFSRQDVLRILRIHVQQLRAWERAGIIPVAESYSFQDLGQLRKLRDLRSKRVSAGSIRASIEAMQQASGMVNPLLEAGTAKDGSRVVFRHLGAIVDPIAGQFLFDFDHKAPSVAGGSGHFRRDPSRDAGAFLEAVQCEESGKIEEAVSIYEAILTREATHAPAAINLGTIFYHRKDYARAEALYRQATVADPKYALAFFDLGNVLDELQRLPEAIEAYMRSIELIPRYADAHYNLALALERKGERRKALKHWSVYVRLDTGGPWHNHARLQIRKILDREKLRIVYRRPAAKL
jgi:tetratricopeptide (TPR) repeat protein